MIDANHEGLGEYHQYLRQGRGKRKRRKEVKSNQGGIIGRVGIENRPTIAAEKTEVGHWESDTMIGGNHYGVIVTHVDKRSKYLGLFWVSGDKPGLYNVWQGFQPLW
jgi:IS30 family transposase